jgi:predicted amidophosphoribosyltransferase
VNARGLLGDGTAVVSVFEPSPPLFSLLHAFKYEGLREMEAWFGVHLARAIQRILGNRAAVLLPIPLHPSRLRERGFNQSHLLARQAALRLGMPLHADLLYRRRPTAPLAGATDAARRAAVHGAFGRRGPLPDRTLQLLLVDDVVTTGATCAAAMQALRAPSERLTVVCLCRARDGATSPEPML